MRFQGDESHILQKHLEMVFMEMANTYPDTFEDKDEDGLRRGNGTASILTKLRTRNDYLNRREMIDGVSDNAHIKRGRQRQLSYYKCGCVQ